MDDDIKVSVDFEDSKQWENVYAPSSDTFFLCDGIKTIADKIPKGAIILEVGSGSGYVTAYTAMLLKKQGKASIHFTTDINIECCKKTYEICTKNGVCISTLRDSFGTSIRGPIDVMIFNPPYVETTNEELYKAIGEHGIAASWAGGDDGAIVIYDILKWIINNPSKFSPNFMFILLISQVNRPVKLKRFCKRNNLTFDMILERNCQGESLKIVTISPTL